MAKKIKRGYYRKRKADEVPVDIELALKVSYRNAAFPRGPQ